MSVRIDYGGVAIGAKDDFAPNITDKENFVDLSELQKDGLSFLNFGNPCDLYSVALDGNVLVFPTDTDAKNLGWWSEQITNYDGSFEIPIVATFEAENFYTSSGITLTFDTFNNIYATSLNIKWYQDETLLSDKNFNPDKPIYFCYNKVEYYNKIVITFNSLNMPYNRLKLYSIEYGMRITFYGNELRTVKIIQEIDPLSTQIPINTCDFVLDSRRDIEYSFEERQPISVYFNETLRSTSFVKKAKRQSKNIWNIQSEDYISLLDTAKYYGGIYTNENAVELLKDIFNVAKVPFDIDDIFLSEQVSGYIPYGSCRDALMQVAFAIGAVVDTSNAEKVKVYALNDEVSQYIPLNRILQGQNFENETRMTSVEVVAHSYKAISDTVTVYDAAESGIGNNLFIKFNEPLHSLSIENGKIISSGTNYAIISAYENCILIGRKYDHTTTIKSLSNPLVLLSDTENIISIQNATLVSASNIDIVLERCYNYYKSNTNINLKIVESKHEVKKPTSLYGSAIYGVAIYGGSAKNTRNLTYDQISEVGQIIDVDTEYSGVNTGIILKQTYNLNGGIVIKDTILKKR